MKRNNRTPHWTDGDQIGRKLTGGKLDAKLNRLAAAANLHHAEVDRAAGGMLEHARLAGESLLEAETRLGGRKKWSRWRAENFKGSKETACHYMRIAREWNNPVLIQAREGGANSINAMLKVLRYGPDAESDQEPSDAQMQEMEVDLERQEIRQQFAGKLKKLDNEKLPDFRSHFGDELWPNMLSYLESLKRNAADDPPECPDTLQTEEDDRAKGIARKQVSDALNGRRKQNRNRDDKTSAAITFAYQAYIEAGGAMERGQFVTECLERPGGIDKVYVEEGLPGG